MAETLERRMRSERAARVVVVREERRRRGEREAERAVLTCILRGF